jgi:hypothetical protein
LQFHIECGPSTVESILKACQSELAELPPEDSFDQYIPRMPAALREQQKLAREMMYAWSLVF